MAWWSWIILGAILLGAEMAVIDAQFYLVFIGVSAGLVGLAGLLGIVMPEWVQWLAFASMALIFMFSFRRAMYEKIHGGVVGFDNPLTGRTLTITSNLSPGGTTRVKHRGSEWTVVNVGESDIAKGSTATVVEIDGLTLHISAD